MLKTAFTAFTGSSRKVAVHEQYTSRQALLPSGDVNLFYTRHKCEDSSDVRFMHMYSAKVDVQTLFVYPHPASDAAVFATETVTLGHRPTIMVLDMPVLSLGKASRKTLFYDAMQAVVQRHGIQNTVNVPDWYRDCRSGSDVFMRPASPEQGAGFTTCLDDMVRLYQHSWGGENSRICEAPAAHLAAIQAYKTHHAEHSPGVPLMSRCFGLEWTTGFMREFFS